MALDVKNCFIKPVLLTLCGLAGLGVTLTLQQVHGQSEKPNPSGSAPTEVPVSQAKSMLQFPIYLPSMLPAGTTVEGAYVTHIRVIDPLTPGEEQARIQANSHPDHGFGVLFFSRNGKITTRSLRGSPAEAAGLPPSETELSSWDGVIAADAYRQFDLFAHQEPMELVIKNEDGKEQTVTVAHPADFTFRPDPTPSIPQDKYIILHIRTLSSGVSLVESPLTLHLYLRPKNITNTTEITVGERQVTLFSTTSTPSAYWTEDGLDFWIDNHTNALSKQDIVKMIASIRKIS